MTNVLPKDLYLFKSIAKLVLYTLPEVAIIMHVFLQDWQVQLISEHLQTLDFK